MAVRQQLRTMLCHCTKQSQDRVAIESVKALVKPKHGVQVTVHVQLGPCHTSAKQLTTACKATLLEIRRDTEAWSCIVEAVGHVDASSLRIHVLDMLPGQGEDVAVVTLTPPETTSTQLIEVRSSAALPCAMSYAESGRDTIYDRKLYEVWLYASIVCMNLRKLCYIFTYHAQYQDIGQSSRFLIRIAELAK